MAAAPVQAAHRVPAPTAELNEAKSQLSDQHAHFWNSTDGGVCVGRYTIRVDDDLDAFDDARVVMRSGNQRKVVRIGESEEQYGYGYGR